MNKKIILIFIFFIGCLSIGGGFFLFGWADTWSSLLVPTMPPPFADSRTVQGSISSIAQGFDPQLINPGDPWERPMNYPKIWVDIARLFSLDREINYLTFVSTYVIIYLSICFGILLKHPSSWLLISIFSGSSLLAVERGNNDLIVFILLYLSSITPILLSGALIIFASVLKIYPILAFASLYNSKKILFAVLALVGFYFIIQIPELQRVRSVTPISATLSYGAPSISEALNLRFNISLNPWALALSMVLLALVTGVFDKIKTLAASELNSSSEFRLFVIGSTVYLGTFIISSNWDYRLIFLIFCIPFIEKLLKNGLKIPLLVAISLASNQRLLTTLLGGTAGGTLCIFAKCAVFVFLIWILQNSLRRLIKFG
jgi:hypothetical protein